MDKKYKASGNNEIEKRKLNLRKNLILLENVDTKKMHVSSIFSSG